jgi:DNA invertase Pin-like site-specific DNA recombinase
VARFVTVWGYARVSTFDQEPAAQLDALNSAGVRDEHLMVEYASGALTSRPGLDELLSKLVRGDVLTVVKLDRLGRSLSHLVRVVADLGERGVEFRSLTEAIDTTTPAGRLVFHLMAAVAEFERELIRERTLAGLAARRAAGGPMGRPSRVTPEQRELISELYNERGMTQKAVAAATGLSRSVVGRVLRREIPSLVAGEGVAA